MKHAHSRKADFDFVFPAPPLNIVLVNPEIPPNTGNIARSCAATGTRLHLVSPMGFTLDNARLRRAGLDYWDAIHVTVHESFAACRAALGDAGRWHFFTTASAKLYTEARYGPGDVLVFGCETKGLAEEILSANAGACFGIPMQTQFVRSLNLSSAAAVVLYEALRQIDISARPH